jgi:hypothetical protein
VNILRVLYNNVFNQFGWQLAIMPVACDREYMKVRCLAQGHLNVDAILVLAGFKPKTFGLLLGHVCLILCFGSFACTEWPSAHLHDY